MVCLPELARWGLVCWLAFLVFADPISASPQDGGSSSLDLVIACGDLQRSALVTMSRASGSEEEVIRRKVQLPWRATVAPLVSNESEWKVEIEAKDCWAPVMSWDGQRSADFHLVPTGQVEGVFELPDGEKEAMAPPAEIEVVFLPTSGSERDDWQDDIVTLSCTIDSLAWSCTLPEGIWNLRLQTSSFAPVFFWQQEIQPLDTMKLATVRLVPGGSITGWVTMPGPSSEAEIRARRLGTGLSAEPSEESRTRLLDWRSQADSHGYFELKGLPRGRYELTASSGDLRSMPVEASLTEPGMDVELGEPLDLQPRAELHLVLQPAVDFWGEPWKIALLGTTDDNGQLETLASGRSSDLGQWSSPRLGMGRYILRISDSAGGPWLHRPLELSGQTENLFLDLDVVRVEGNLSMGDEPLAGDVLFGRGTPNIKMVSDESGRFAGYFPEEKKWAAEVALESGSVAIDPVEVRIPDGKSHAELEITLPDTRIHGTVSYDDEPIDALVLALRGNLDARERNPEERLRVDMKVITGEDGEYDLRGVPPGDLQLRASRGQLVSEWRDVRLEDGDELELDFELEEKSVRQGALRLEGAPVSGAKVFFAAQGGLSGSTTSRVDGTFEISLREEVRQVDLLVHPPLGGLTFRRVVFDNRGDTPFEIRLSGRTGEFVNLDPRVPSHVGFGGVRFPFTLLLRMLGSEIYAHPEGGLAIPNVEAGVWQLCPTHSARAERCQVQEILPGSHSQFLLKPDRQESP